MRGVGLAADEWRAGAPEIADLLAPIRAFTAATAWQAHELSESQAAKLRDAIAPNVRALHAYWLARRARRRRASRCKRVRRCAWGATTCARAAVARNTRNAACSDGISSSGGDPALQESRASPQAISLRDRP